MKVSSEKKHSFAVLIPAHNEEVAIPALIDSLYKQDYPKDLFDIYVVSDNCSDNTYNTVKDLGVNVFKRIDDDNKGKDHSLDWLMQKVKGTSRHYDGFVFFDADNVVEKDFLKIMSMCLNQGYHVIQASVYGKNVRDSGVSGFIEIANIMLDIVQKLRTNLGFTSLLIGRANCFSKSIVERFDWHIKGVDIDFQCELMKHGIKVIHTDKTRVFEENVSNYSSVRGQRTRWFLGKLKKVLQYAPSLVKNSIKRMDFILLESMIYVLIFPSHSVFAVLFMLFFIFEVVLFLLNKIPGYLIWISSGLGLLYLLFIIGVFVIGKIPFRMYNVLLKAPFFAVNSFLAFLKSFFYLKSKKWIHTKHTENIRIDDVKKDKK